MRINLLKHLNSSLIKKVSTWSMPLVLPLFLQATPAYPQENPQEIRIYLKTKSPLEPIYFAKVQNEEASFTPDYLKELEKIFRYDLSHNGSTSLTVPDAEKESLLSDKNKAKAFNPSVWKQTSVQYVFKAIVHKQALSLHIYNPKTDSVKSLNEIPLTGDLKKDRREIHKVMDAAHKALFGEDGIASTHILYSLKSDLQSQDGKWIAEIWMCDADGASARQITKEKSYSITPVFIPLSTHYDNDHFLYVSYKMGQPKIYISSFGEGKGRRIVQLRGNQFLPSISQKRDKIAFICDAAGRPDLFVQEFSPADKKGSKPTRLFTKYGSTQGSPVFNPDGSKIAFVSDKDGSPRIYVIKSHKSGKEENPILISKENRENSCPSWSPDGKKLAYSAKTKGTRQIWIYDFETGEEWQLTEGAGNKENPSWARNSRHLVFNSTDGAISELYVVNLNQSECVKISKETGIKQYPSWGK